MFCKKDAQNDGSIDSTSDLKPKKAVGVTNTVRTADGKFKTLNYTRRQAIRLFCTECMGWSDDPKTCTAPHCPLYPFRGKTIKAYHGDKE